MPRSHYLLYGNACEVIQKVIFQSLTLDKKPKGDFRTMIMGSYNHFHCFSRSKQDEKEITYIHRHLPGRMVYIGRIRKTNYRRFKAVIRRLEQEKPVKCQTRHLYWISQIVSRCIKLKILEPCDFLHMLQARLFEAHSIPEPEKPDGPPESWAIFKGIKKFKDLGRNIALKTGAYAGPDDKEIPAHPFFYDAGIPLPDGMGTNDKVLKTKKEAQEAAEKAHKEAVELAKKERRLALVKTPRDKDGKRIKDSKENWKNNMSGWVPDLKDDEMSVVTDPDFASNYKTLDEADLPKPKPTYHDDPRHNAPKSLLYGHRRGRHRHGHHRRRRAPSPSEYAEEDHSGYYAESSAGDGYSPDRRERPPGSHLTWDSGTTSSSGSWDSYEPRRRYSRY
ncbi:hypothetical protein CJF31_00008248 [Rutstroemia sp. NJR-2017a BVV2]|nr:hypothetical protein CJF31_00008248 [Rutstroemia sp. NJR-2017a BVV2]